MKVYMDENLPRHLAQAFHILQDAENLKHGRKKTEVVYLPDEFGHGAEDPDWLQDLPPHSYVITKDYHISRRKDEIEAYLKNKVGLFILRGKSRKENPNVWELLFILVKNWEEMLKVMQKQKGPFAYVVKPNQKLKPYK